MTTPSASTPKSATIAVPAQVSDFPAGTYRTQLSVTQLRHLGVADLSSAGTWTLTVKAGTYRLECVTISVPGTDCGHRNPSRSRTVEIGALRGAAPTIWFVLDMERLSKATGCVQHSDADKGCGVVDPYHFNWTKVPHGIAFSDSPDAAGGPAEFSLNVWTVQPWTRIS